MLNYKSNNGYITDAFGKKFLCCIRTQDKEKERQVVFFSYLSAYFQALQTIWVSKTTLSDDSTSRYMPERYIRPRICFYLYSLLKIAIKQNPICTYTQIHVRRICRER